MSKKEQFFVFCLSCLVSFKVATAVGQKTAYIRNRGLDESVCKHLIMQALDIQPSTMPELLEVLDRGALSAVLSPDQKARKVSNLLQKMKNGGIVYPVGPRNKAKWHATKSKTKYCAFVLFSFTFRFDHITPDRTTKLIM